MDFATIPRMFAVQKNYTEIQHQKQISSPLNYTYTLISSINGLWTVGTNGVNVEYQLGDVREIAIQKMPQLVSLMYLNKNYAILQICFKEILISRGLALDGSYGIP